MQNRPIHSKRPTIKQRLHIRGALVYDDAVSVPMKHIYAGLDIRSSLTHRRGSTV